VDGLRLVVAFMRFDPRSRDSPFICHPPDRVERADQESAFLSPGPRADGPLFPSLC